MYNELFGFFAGIGSGIAFSVSFIVPGFNFREKLNLVMGICIGGSGLGMFAISPLMEYIPKLLCPVKQSKSSAGSDRCSYASVAIRV